MSADVTMSSFQYLQQLDDLTFTDNQADIIEAPAIAIAYCNTSDLNYSDDRLYALPSNALQYFSKESGWMAKLRDQLELGQRMLALLYSYRAVSRGIPQAQNSEQANRPELYQTAYAVLAPEIGKMKSLLKFCDESTTLLTSVFKALLPEYKESAFPSIEFLLVLAQTMDLLLVIDSLKNGKASLNNDFSMYKRIISNLKNLVENVDDETLENHQLYNFLGTQNVFAVKLKEKFAAIPDYEELMIDVVSACADMIEQKQYVAPDMKHMLLKAMTFGLFFLESVSSDTKEVYKRKNFRLDRFGKILKVMPVVPLYGDMSLTLTSLFIKVPKLKEQKWDHDPSDETLQKSYKITHHLESMRAQYQDYLLQYKLTSNMVRIQLAKNEFIDQDQYEPLYNILLRGITMLSDWTSRVLEQSAWKFANPTSNYVNSSCPADASLYEMAVRYNYDTQEQFALVEVIGMIKSVSQILLGTDNNVLTCVLKFIHTTTQTFLRTTLKDMINNVAKKKKPILQTMLHLFGIMETMEPDFVEDAKPKKGNDSNALFTVRAVGLSMTQMYYIRALLGNATNEKAKGMQGGFMKEKDFKDDQVAKVNEFLSRAFFFPSLLNFSETVRSCGDLSELWYKEFYLELTKQIQFPIEMSLPWILTSSVLESEAPELIEWILYPLDIYNDAANRALHRLRAQFLYDEIEAEVNLCFDQFIWKLSQKVFADYKTRAASHMLDKYYKQELEYMLNTTDNRFDLANIRYSTILKQKRFQLLGRTICISRHVGQFCNQHLRQSIDIAIGRYEANDLTFIIELESLLASNKLVHTYLSEHLTLDPFEDILAEADEETSLVHYNGRIVGHTIQELLTDFIPMYCYNSTTQRFVRRVDEEADANRGKMPPVLPMYLYGTKQMYQAYFCRYLLYKNFIGTPHFSAIARVLGTKHMDVVLGELSKSVDLMLKYNVTPYIKAMAKGIPHATKLPPFDYGAKGCSDYFQVILKPILGYKDLLKIFNVFREFGNVIIFFKVMEGVLKNQSLAKSILSAPFVGVVSRLTDTKPDPKFMVRNVMEEVHRVLTTNDSVIPYNQQGERAEQMSLHYPTIRFMNRFLSKLQQFLIPLRAQWEHPLPRKDELQVEHSAEFYRVWSALHYAFCLPYMPKVEGKPAVLKREVFGEGPIWAGCVLVHLFDEVKRFTAFDFTRFLTYAAQVDKKSMASLAVPDVKMFENAEFYCNLDQEVFEFLEYRFPLAAEFKL